jgi:hypothetical protein
MRQSRGSMALACMLAAWSAGAAAHSFSTPYVLPIPYWMYVYGCAATLIVTFAGLSIFVSGGVAPERAPPSAPSHVGSKTRPVGHWLLIVLRAGAFLTLLVTLVEGFVGSGEATRNLSLTLFWVVFLLAWTYLTVLVGDLYPFVNPWLTIANGLTRIGMPLSKSRLRYPDWLRYWPALVMYLALIWAELFVEQTPRSLSTMLLAYTAVTLLGMALFGKREWLEQADVFAVLFRIIGKMAPVEYISDDAEGIRAIRLRPPFSGLLSERPRRISLLLFILFMLSSTAYDGIHDTQLWTALFWRNMLDWLQPWWGDDLAKAQAMLMGLFLVYRQLGLLVFPFIYLLIFLATLLVAKWLTRSTLSLPELALRFTYSLVPIAFAYQFAHYYTLLIVQLRELPALFAGMVGAGAMRDGPPQEVSAIALDMGIVWHVQVGAILLGHVVSVALAHREALRVFPGRREALLSELPLLILMITYTMLGLWILTLPLG